MINNIAKLLLVMVAVMFGHSCSNIQEELNTSDQSEAIEFYSNIIKPTTRVVGTQWENQDAIGLTSFEAGKQDAQVSKNVKYVTSGNGKFTASNVSEAIKIEPKQTLDFVAYYPFNESVKSNQIEIDLSNQSNRSKLDLLYASNVKGVSSADQKLELNFKHQLSQVILVFNKGGGITSLEGFDVASIEGVLTSGVFDIVSGKLNVESTKSALSNIQILKTKEEAIVSFLILPGQALNDIVIKSTVEGKNFKLNLKNSIAKSATKYTYTAVVSLDGTVSVAPGADIEDWEVEKDDEQDLYPNDKDGNKDKEPQVSSVKEVVINHSDKSFKLPIQAKNDVVAWNISSSEEWLIPQQIMGSGSAEITVSTTENLSAEKRKGKLILKAGTFEIIVQVVQNEYFNANLQTVVVMNESFGDTKNATIDFDYKKFNEYTGYDSEGYIFSNMGSRVTVIGKNTVQSGNHHIWFPAAKKPGREPDGYVTPTLNIKNINTGGLIDIEISFDITGDIGNKPIDTDYMNISVDGKALEVPSHALSNADNNIYYTTIVKVDKPFTELEISTDERNHKGIRFDNLKITGKKK